MAERRPKKAAEALGLGLLLDEVHHGFVVRLGERGRDVIVFEHSDFDVDDAGALTLPTNPAAAMVRVRLARTKWNEIAPPFSEEATRRLKRPGLATPKQPTKGDMPMHPSLGKELCVLCWAIEDAEHDVIPAAVQNWEGLAPEERWWLYTMTAAATGQAQDAGRGWRKALQYALTDNPISSIRDGLAPRAKRELLAEALGTTKQTSLL